MLAAQAGLDRHRLRPKLIAGPSSIPSTRSEGGGALRERSAGLPGEGLRATHRRRDTSSLASVTRHEQRPPAGCLIAGPPSSDPNHDQPASSSGAVPAITAAARNRASARAWNYWWCLSGTTEPSRSGCNERFASRDPVTGAQPVGCGELLVAGPATGQEAGFDVDASMPLAVLPLWCRQLRGPALSCSRAAHPPQQRGPRLAPDYFFLKGGASNLTRVLAATTGPWNAH